MFESRIRHQYSCGPPVGGSRSRFWPGVTPGLHLPSTGGRLTAHPAGRRRRLCEAGAPTSSGQVISTRQDGSWPLRCRSGAYAAEIFSYKFSLNQCAADVLLKKSICRRTQEATRQVTRAGCDRVRRHLFSEYRPDKMTPDALERFFSASRAYFGLQRPMPVSSVFPFSKLACPEGSRPLHSGSLPPLSPDGALAKRANPEAPS